MSPADPPLPGFTQSRDSAVLKEDRKAALGANVLFQSGTQGAQREGPVRRYRGVDPTAMSLKVNKEPSLTAYQMWHPPLTQPRVGNDYRNVVVFLKKIYTYKKSRLSRTDAHLPNRIWRLQFAFSRLAAIN